MKDLDFDELDRAVSSLLGAEQTPDGQQVGDDTVQDPKPQESAESSTATSVADEPVETPQKKPLIEKRNSGRFMDVVHPSSDMKNLQKPSISRQAPSITPLSKSDDTIEEKIEPQKEEEIVPEGVEATISQEQKDGVVANEETAANDTHTMPDPLDFHNFSFDKEVKEESSNALTETPVDETVQEDSAHDIIDADDIDQDAIDDDHELALDKMASELHELDGLMVQDDGPVSVETPFINGSMIEKRPLGAFSIDTPDESLLSVKEEATVDEDQQSADDTATTKEKVVTTEIADKDAVIDDVDAQIAPSAEVIPEELQGDILAIESAEAVSTPVPGHSSPIEAGSITQQYVEKARPATDTQTPVFDTTQYHKPLKHTAKQKSGWLTVLLIVAFLVVGAGAGAALYYFDPFGLL